MTKIIFLDVDGVLNSWDYYDRVKDTYKSMPHLESDIDPKAVDNLNKIIDTTGAKIVVSSTWRLNHYEELIDILKKMGCHGEVIDKTPRNGCYACLRGNNILTWIKDNDALIGEPYHVYKNYVILDDDSDMLYWQKDNFVKTHAQTGLTESHAEQAIRILNQGAISVD